MDLDEFMLVTTNMKDKYVKCDFQGSNLQDLAKHSVIDRNKSKHSCDDCGKHFVDGNKLVDHIQK